MRTHRIIVALSVVMCAASTAAQQMPGQQQGNFTGQWLCDYAYTEMDQNGNRTSGNVAQYQIYFDPSQQFQMQGIEMSVAGQMQVYGPGQWRAELDPASGQQYLIAQGQKVDQTGFAMPWMMMAAPQMDGSMGITHEQPNPQTGAAMTRLNIACRRM